MQPLHIQDNFPTPKEDESNPGLDENGGFPLYVFYQFYGLGVVVICFLVSCVAKEDCQTLSYWLLRNKPQCYRIVFFVKHSILNTLPSFVVATYFGGPENSFEDVVQKKNARLFKSSLNWLQVGLSGAIHQSLVSNSRRVEVQHPTFGSIKSRVFFFGRLFWKKTSLKVVHNLSNCSEFNFFSVASILLQGEIAAAYTMDRERDMDFGWVSWFERLKFQMILFIASKGCDSYFLVEETAELSNSQSFFHFWWIMMLRSHFLIMTSHLWLYFLGWFHTDICYSLLSTSLLLEQLWSTEVCYGRLLFYTSQSVPWHGFFNVLHLKPSMGHLWRRNTKVCSMMFPWKIGILKVPSQLKKIYYMYIWYICFSKKIAFLWGHCFYGLFHPWHVPGWEILCGQKETDQEDCMNYPAILPHSTSQKLEI